MVLVLAWDDEEIDGVNKLLGIGAKGELRASERFEQDNPNDRFRTNDGQGQSEQVDHQSRANDPQSIAFVRAIAWVGALQSPSNVHVAKRKINPNGQHD